MDIYQQYYLIIRPISEDSSIVESYIKSIAEITRLDSLTVKQKYTGSALQILMIHQDPDHLGNICEDLKKNGFHHLSSIKMNYKKQKNLK